MRRGSDEDYLDKNYAGVLIVWDKLFGTFEPERERVRYGLTTNIETFNPLRVAFHEWVAVWHDVRAAGTWRERLGYMFKGPGWRPPPTEPKPQTVSKSTLIRPESAASRRAA